MVVVSAAGGREKIFQKLGMHGTISYRNKSCGKSDQKGRSVRFYKRKSEFQSEIIDPKHETVGIVTNNFHSYRAKLLAEQEGYAHVFSVSASSNYVFQINYLVREFFAVLAIFLKNKRIL